MPSPPEATSRAAARKQALQDQVLALIQDRRLAGIALTMGLGKTLVGLRDMARLLAAGSLPAPALPGKPFLVAAPTQAILDAWPQEAHKLGFSLQRDTVGEFIFKPLRETVIARKQPDGSKLTALRLTNLDPTRLRQQYPTGRKITLSPS